jgi:hypothetical protein
MAEGRMHVIRKDPAALDGMIDDLEARLGSR